jgi:hypothetical protein
MAYVYRHIRLDKNEPFYIGIGSDTEGKYKRAKSKRDRNNHWHNIIACTNYKVQIMLDELTWGEACEKEIELIAFYGRRDLNLGTLVNMTDGGEGLPNPSEESKIKMSKSQKKLYENGYVNPMKGVCGEKSAWYGRKHSKETKDKLSAKKMGVNNPMYGKKTNTAKKVIDINTNVIYDSAYDAYKYLYKDTMNYNYFRSKLNNNSEFINDTSLRYIDNNGKPIEKIIKKSINKSLKSVINLQNGFIYDSAYSAYEASGIKYGYNSFTRKLRNERKNDTNYEFINNIK